MPDLVNVGDPVDVYATARSSDSLHVDTGQTITVPGDLADEQSVVAAALATEPGADAARQGELTATAIASLPSDAFLIGEGDDARLWPHSRWQLATPPPPAQSKKSAAQSVPTDASGAGQSKES